MSSCSFTHCGSKPEAEEEDEKAPNRIHTTTTGYLTPLLLLLLLLLRASKQERRRRREDGPKLVALSATSAQRQRRKGVVCPLTLLSFSLLRLKVASGKRGFYKSASSLRGERMTHCFVDQHILYMIPFFDASNYRQCFWN